MKKMKMTFQHEDNWQNGWTIETMGDTTHVSVTSPTSSYPAVWHIAQLDKEEPFTKACIQLLNDYKAYLRTQ